MDNLAIENKEVVELLTKLSNLNQAVDVVSNVPVPIWSGEDFAHMDIATQTVEKELWDKWVKGKVEIVNTLTYQMRDVMFQLHTILCSKKDNPYIV